MTLTYVDTSAAMKLLIDEDESEAIEAVVADGRRLVSSWLLHTELHCAVGRHPESVDPHSVDTLLRVVDLVDVSRAHLVAAGTLRPLRSHDAIHLSVAISVSADDLLTYDSELAAAAVAAGLTVTAPG